MVRLFAAYLPASGLVGLALFQALTEHRWETAFQTLGEAAVLFGVGKVGGQLFQQHKETQAALKAAPDRRLLDNDDGA
jgi:hypothetical protein